MQLLAVLAVILAVASAGHQPVSTWTLTELSNAVHDPTTDPAILPYLESALNQLMVSLFAGEQQTSIVISVPYEATWTSEELAAVVHDPATDPALLPYYETAFHDLMVNQIADPEVTSITFSIPAMEVNYWTLAQLDAALSNPETDPELAIYLEHALDMFLDALHAGNQLESIAVLTPPGVYAVAPEVDIVVPQPIVLPPIAPSPVVIPPVVPEPVIIVPSPVLPAPIVPEPVIVPNPVVPTPVAPEAVVEPSPAAVPEASSPLVQIIVNINTQQTGATAAASAPFSVADGPNVVERPMPQPTMSY